MAESHRLDILVTLQRTIFVDNEFHELGIPSSYRDISITNVHKLGVLEPL